MRITFNTIFCGCHWIVWRFVGINQEMRFFPWLKPNWCSAEPKLNVIGFYLFLYKVRIVMHTSEKKILVSLVNILNKGNKFIVWIANFNIIFSFISLNPLLFSWLMTLYRSDSFTFIFSVFIPIISGSLISLNLAFLSL